MYFKNKKVEMMTNFIFLDFKITAKVTVPMNFKKKKKRCLLLGRKAMTNLDSILKSRDIALLTKICIVKTMAFPVVIQPCELDHKEG